MYLRTTDERKYTEYLYIINNQTPVFNFEYDFPDEYKPKFEQMFLDRYAFRQIASDSVNQFRIRFKAKVNQVSSYYVSMYKSINVFSNPFVNYVSQVEYKGTNGERSKLFQTNHLDQQSLLDSANARIGNALDVTNEVGKEARQNTNNRISNSKERSQNYQNTTSSSVSNNLYSDSPQNSVSALGGNETVNITITPTGTSNTTNAGSGWNDGYITKANRDTLTQANATEGETSAGQTSNDNTRISDEHADERLTGRNTILRDIDEKIDKSLMTGYSDTRKDDVKLIQDERTTLEYGLKGTTLSDAVIEWRKSFIKIDQMFLDEFEDLFLQVF